MGLARQQQQIADAIAGLRVHNEQLKSGAVRLLFARPGDTEWADGAPEIIPFNNAILSILRTIQQKRNKRSKRKAKEQIGRKRR